VTFIQTAFRSAGELFIEENVENTFKMLQFEVALTATSRNLRLQGQKLRQHEASSQLPTLTVVHQIASRYEISGYLRLDFQFTFHIALENFYRMI
jgi:hypothetical protein